MRCRVHGVAMARRFFFLSVICLIGFGITLRSLLPQYLSTLCSLNSKLYSNSNSDSNSNSNSNTDSNINSSINNININDKDGARDESIVNMDQAQTFAGNKKVPKAVKRVIYPKVLLLGDSHTQVKYNNKYILIVVVKVFTRY